MHSSTSNSEAAAERVTGAADANTYWVKPLPERRVPRVAWRTAAVTALALFVCALGTWEWRMRTLGLEAGDLGATRGAWVAARRRIDAGDVPLAIMGSSRILFGTSLNEFERSAGVRPLQLAMQGSSTRRFMADIAADADFKGLLIVDATPLNFYRSGGGLFDGVLDHYRDQSLSQRSDHWLDQRLQRHFAYLDADYRLLKLIERESILPERDGVGGPYRTVWKVAETYDDRQTYTWDRLQQDERLRAHAIAVWRGNMKRPPALSAAEFAAVIAETRSDVEKIRARGGDVIFVRPPSCGELAKIEDAKFPRAQTWDRLLIETRALGFHFADHAATRALSCVEESHLSRADAVLFTRAYAEFVRSLNRRSVPQ
jgi:hypothetical protein